MNVIFSFQKDNSQRLQKQKVNFGAGLTPQMIQEIQRADVLQISNRLAKKGIPTDFRDNKVLAWCSDKTVEIFQQLNERFDANLALPKGIYVEDFKKLNVDSQYLLGTCNLRPTFFRKGSNERTPSRTIFFNTMHNWNNINSMSDVNYAEKHFSTDLFLYPFLHEFSHVIHENRLLNKLGGKKLNKMLEDLNEESQIQKYRKLYNERVKQICNYAANTPLDAIACDLPKVIVNSLNKETLMPTKNPFIGTPYEEPSFLKKWLPQKKYSDQDRPLQEILRNFWNGKFD